MQPAWIYIWPMRQRKRALSTQLENKAVHPLLSPYKQPMPSHQLRLV